MASAVVMGINAMSRAFVKDQDDAFEELADRPLSQNPNFVTARGLRLMDEEIECLRAEFAEAQRTRDRAALARISRDLRYWTQRRTTAQLIPPPEKLEKVAFATRVTIEREDGRRQTFTITGEDEGDPSHGYIAYTAPLARAVLGKAIGEFAEAPGGGVEIAAIDRPQDN
jgi:transcription elongation GreA/GreB family factor